MRKINFAKMVAAGNDFVVIESNPCIKRYTLNAIAQQVCNRKYGIGADGLLLLEQSKTADAKMRIFNSDGSEAEMCGNGARCAALYKSKIKNQKSKVKIETRAGIIQAYVAGDNVKIKLTDPENIKLDIPLKINGRSIKVNFINTGVPHVVIFVEGLDKIDVAACGRQIRYHKKFSPKGTNADFVEVLNKDSIRIRTYERGVEDETLACGTGSVAAALLYALRYTLDVTSVDVHTRSGEVLKVYFERINNKFIRSPLENPSLRTQVEGGSVSIPDKPQTLAWGRIRLINVWLEGRAQIVYKGEYYV